jgi:hypothetical protein
MNVGRFAGGLLIGVVLAGVVTLAMTGGSSGTTAPTTTTTAAVVETVEPWFMPGEVLIGATAILPVSLDVEDGVAFFDYDLVGLAPSLSSNEEQTGLAMPAGDPLELPESWQLTTVAGSTVTATTGPSDTSVSFELPSAEDEVATITLVGWRIPVPFGDTVTLPVEQGAHGELRQGTVTFSSVLEQSISTIVTVDFDRDGDLWHSWVILRPGDGRWRASGRQGGGLQLTWDGSDHPDSIVLENAGYDLSPVSGSLLVYDTMAAP